MAYKLIFFTGAGISLDSGIPTFEQNNGLRDKLTRRYALDHTNDYIDAIKRMKSLCENAKPNKAHLSIATLDCPVITMNIDELHKKAGSSHVLELHGRLPSDEELLDESLKFKLGIPVLYGDPAPNYKEAIRLVKSLEYDNSYFVIVGTSFYTNISGDLLKIAKQKKAEIIIINDNASERVPKIVHYLKNKLQI